MDKTFLAQSSMAVWGICIGSSVLFAQVDPPKPVAPRAKVKGSLPDDQIRQDSFRDTLRAAKAVEAGIAAGVSSEEFADLVRNYSDCAAKLPVARNAKEKAVVSDLMASLEIYKDTITIWNRKIASEGYGNIPKNHCSILMLEVAQNTGFGKVINNYKLQPLIRNQDVFGEELPGVAYLDVRTALSKLWSKASELAANANAVVAS